MLSTLLIVALPLGTLPTQIQAVRCLTGAVQWPPAPAPYSTLRSVECGVEWCAVKTLIPERVDVAPKQYIFNCGAELLCGLIDKNHDWPPPPGTRDISAGLDANFLCKNSGALWTCCGKGAMSNDGRTASETLRAYRRLTMTEEALTDLEMRVSPEEEAYFKYALKEEEWVPYDGPSLEDVFLKHIIRIRRTTTTAWPSVSAATTRATSTTAPTSTSSTSTTTSPTTTTTTTTTPPPTTSSTVTTTTVRTTPYITTTTPPTTTSTPTTTSSTSTITSTPTTSSSSSTSTSTSIEPLFVVTVGDNEATAQTVEPTTVFEPLLTENGNAYEEKPEEASVFVPVLLIIFLIWYPHLSQFSPLKQSSPFTTFWHSIAHSLKHSNHSRPHRGRMDDIESAQLVAGDLSKSKSHVEDTRDDDDSDHDDMDDSDEKPLVKKRETRPMVRASSLHAMLSDTLFDWHAVHNRPKHQSAPSTPSVIVGGRRKVELPTKKAAGGSNNVSSSSGSSPLIIPRVSVEALAQALTDNTMHRVLSPTAAGKHGTSGRKSSASARSHSHMTSSGGSMCSVVQNMAAAGTVPATAGGQVGTPVDGGDAVEMQQMKGDRGSGDKRLSSTSSLSTSSTSSTGEADSPPLPPPFMTTSGTSGSDVIPSPTLVSPLAQVQMTRALDAALAAIVLADYTEELPPHFGGSGVSPERSPRPDTSCSSELSEADLERLADDADTAIYLSAYTHSLLSLLKTLSQLGGGGGGGVASLFPPPTSISPIPEEEEPADTHAADMLVALLGDTQFPLAELEPVQGGTLMEATPLSVKPTPAPTPTTKTAGGGAAASRSASTSSAGGRSSTASTVKQTPQKTAAGAGAGSRRASTASTAKGGAGSRRTSTNSTGSALAAAASIAMMAATAKPTTVNMRDLQTYCTRRTAHLARRPSATSASASSSRRSSVSSQPPAAVGRKPAATRGSATNSSNPMSSTSSAAGSRRSSVTSDAPSAISSRRSSASGGINAPAAARGAAARGRGLGCHQALPNKLNLKHVAAAERCVDCQRRAGGACIAAWFDCRCGPNCSCEGWGGRRDCKGWTSWCSCKGWTSWVSCKGRGRRNGCKGWTS